MRMCRRRYASGKSVYSFATFDTKDTKDTKT